MLEGHAGLRLGSSSRRRSQPATPRPLLIRPACPFPDAPLLPLSLSLHQVIIIPIYWNHNKEEKERVIRAAEKVKGMLSEAGINVDMDASNKYTPGQKMKYW